MQPRIRRDMPIEELTLDALNPRLAPREVKTHESQENLTETLKRMVGRKEVEEATLGLLPPEPPMLAVVEAGTTIVIDGNLSLVRRRLALSAEQEVEGVEILSPSEKEAITRSLEYTDVAVYQSRAEAYPAQSRRKVWWSRAWNSHALERFLRNVCDYHSGDIRQAHRTTSVNPHSIAQILAAGDLLNQLNPGRKDEPSDALPQVRLALQHQSIVERLGVNLDISENIASSSYRCPEDKLPALAGLMKHLLGYERKDGTKAQGMARRQNEIRRLAEIYQSDRHYRKLMAEAQPNRDFLWKEMNGTATLWDLKDEAKRLETAAESVLSRMKRDDHPELPSPNAPVKAAAQMKVSADGYIPTLHISWPEGKAPKRLAEAVRQGILEEWGINCLVTR